jgi:hypothetical protein
MPAVANDGAHDERDPNQDPHDSPCQPHAMVVPVGRSYQSHAAPRPGASGTARPFTRRADDPGHLAGG